MKPRSSSRRMWITDTAGRSFRTSAGMSRQEMAPRVAPREQLVNTLEFGAQAERVLPGDVFAGLAGSDRTPFDRITFRPRMMVNCTGLDLSTEFAGASLFAPIIVGPMANQRLIHPDAERATVQGAGAAQAAVVVSAVSSIPVEDLARGATTPLFVQVFAGDEPAQSAASAQVAVQAGCKAVFVTIGRNREGSSTGRVEWAAVEALERAVTVPLVVKGVTSADQARRAVTAGASAIVVSNYGQPATAGVPASLDVLPAVVDAIGGRFPVLIDGGFRRGTDIMKALALGARAVLVGRPVMWGLAAYGAEGVQNVIEMLQTELGRVMGCCGTPNLAAITRDHVKVHG